MVQTVRGRRVRDCRVVESEDEGANGPEAESPWGRTFRKQRVREANVPEAESPLGRTVRKQRVRWGERSGSKESVEANGPEAESPGGERSEDKGSRRRMVVGS